ncbi:MAG: type II secretion system protein [Candidatus Omnitrophica bacterium]|nr:type II secretion system protein [Candidatus Omnitrophota bacterium]
MFKKKGFVLVELMVAVSILAIGIVFVLRSFLNSSSALNSITNKLGAIAILENKLADVELSAKNESGCKVTDTQEEMVFNNRKAIFKTLIKECGTKEKKSPFNQVTLSLSWQEENKSKDETLATYLPAK